MADDLKLFAFGNVAHGVFAVGNCAFGIVSIGGSLSVGVIAIGGNAVGSLVAIGGNAVGPFSLSLINGLGVLTYAGVNGAGVFGESGTNNGSSATAGFVFFVAALIGIYAARRVFPAPPPAARELADIGSLESGETSQGWVRAKSVRTESGGFAIRVSGVNEGVRSDPSPPPTSVDLEVAADRPIFPQSQHILASSPRVLVLLAAVEIPAAQVEGGYRDAPATHRELSVLDVEAEVDPYGRRRRAARTIHLAALIAATLASLGAALVRLAID